MGIDARVFAAVDKYDYIEWSSGQRLFEDHYWRGHWPTLRQQIITLIERFPEFPVYYMSDQQPWNERGEEWLATPERIQRLDELWVEALREKR